MSGINQKKELENLVITWNRRSKRFSDMASLSQDFEMKKKYEENKAKADAFREVAAQLEEILNTL